MSGWPVTATTTRLLLVIVCIASFTGWSPAPPESVARGWLAWRGPQQNGTSAETGLPDKVDSSTPLWSIDLAGRGTPVINGNKLYVLGYKGEGADLQQVLRCVNADSGPKRSAICRKGFPPKARQVQELGGRALAIRCDMSRAEDVKAALDKALEAFRRLDFAFNNAGGERRSQTLLLLSRPSLLVEQMGKIVP